MVRLVEFQSTIDKLGHMVGRPPGHGTILVMHPVLCEQLE